MEAARVLALVGATLVDGTERPPVRDAVARIAHTRSIERVLHDGRWVDR